jgi:hypothetical protein
MQGFMEYIGAKEKADNVKYCDGIDFHSYPFWSSAPTAPAMMAKIDYTADQSDSLVTWIKNNLVAPDSVYVMMSEFNSSVVLSDLLQKRINGSFSGEHVSPDISINSGAGPCRWYGTRMKRETSVRSCRMGRAQSFQRAAGDASILQCQKPLRARTGAFILLQNVWIDPKKDNTVVKATYNRSDSVRAYGMKTADDFRALLINISSDSLPVDCSLSGGNYTQADVYTWSAGGIRLDRV